VQQQATAADEKAAAMVRTLPLGLPLLLLCEHKTFSVYTQHATIAGMPIVHASLDQSRRQREAAGAEAPDLACAQAAFRAEQEAALRAAEKQSDLPGAFTDCTNSPGVRTRAQARKML
jgi:hypothetical protein